MDSHKDIFDRIYRFNVWGNGSGSGSTYENCKTYVQYLENFLKYNEIKSVCDVGCGDWQFSKHINWKNIEYTGIDVSSVVLENTKKHAKDNIKFIELNAVTDDLPPAQLLIMKDVIQHWSNQDIIDFIPKFEQYEYCLITNGFLTTMKDQINQDIHVGGFRPVDLTKEPFNVHGTYVSWFFADEFRKILLITNKKGLN